MRKNNNKSKLKSGRRKPIIRHDLDTSLNEEIMDDGLGAQEPNPIIEQIIELGREKGFITINDILAIFPQVERDLDQLEETYAALLAAKIPYLDEAPDSGEHEKAAVEIVAEEEVEENHLSNVDADDSVGLYLKEVGRVPLLTAEQEVSLSKRIELGRFSREELARGSVAPKRRFELRLGIEDGWAAREHLITANSRLVISVAKKYMGRGVPFLDLIQEGNIGLIRAAKKFDYRRGHKFSTYATWWIRQAVTRAIADQGRIEGKKVTKFWISSVMG